MKVADVNCRVVSGLLSRWYDGTLEAVDADLYEQHVMVCPPCRRQNDKLHDALAALKVSADARPPAALLAELDQR